jgi:hypothetical protein
VGLSLVLSACSGLPGLLSPKENADTLPFNDSSQHDGISPTQAFASSSIPAGTAIVIELQSSLSSAACHSGEQFQAVLNEPILVQGRILIQSGSAITGRILAAKASEARTPGYLRLTLSSVVLKGKAVDVHTSTVFSKGRHWLHLNIGSGAANEVRFSTGRRLTFRLIEPLPLQG